MAQMAPLGLKARCPAGTQRWRMHGISFAWPRLRGVQDQVQGAMAVMQAAGCLRLAAYCTLSCADLGQHAGNGREGLAAESAGGCGSGMLGCGEAFVFFPFFRRQGPMTCKGLRKPSALERSRGP